MNELSQIVKEDGRKQIREDDKEQIYTVWQRKNISAVNLVCTLSGDRILKAISEPTE